MKNQSMAVKAGDPERRKYWLALAVIVLISFIASLPVLHNGFLAWDDEGYITKNPLIYSINLKEIFSQNVMGNYHPVTMLVLALEYHFFGLNATGYHAVSLLIHLLNVVLVFQAVYLLSEKAGVALVASLLFGIHPVHVESVAWASELKDLLYTFFFLASYIFYLKYLKEQQKKYYLFALLLFSVSLLSKAMAASLPVVLVLTDYFRGRKINIKTMVEKAPFFLLALALGVLAIMAQKISDSNPDMTISTFPQRLVFASYGFFSYLFKLLVPLNLSAYYPYPVKDGADMPIRYYAYVLSFIVLTTCVIYSLRFSGKFFFGIVFFTITIFLVLQLLPVGNAIMADRYSYIPSIGIFYLAGEGFSLLWRKKLRPAALILLSAFTVFFSVTTYARCGVWKNDLTLWNDVIGQYQNIAFAYLNRGVVFKNENRNDEAISDFNKAIELQTGYADAYNNRGVVYMNEKRNNEALSDYNKAITLKPGYAGAYYNRGVLFMNEKRNAEALSDFNKAIELKPGYADAYNNRGNVFKNEKRNAEALSDYNKAITLKPGYAEGYYNRGNVFKNEKRNAEAIRDFNKAIWLKPSYAEAYNNRGNVFYREKRYEEAISDFNKTIELQPGYAEAYNNRGNVFYIQKRYEEAIRDYTKAIAMRTDYAQAYYNRGLAEFYSGKKDAACTDLERAAGSGYQPAADALLQMCKR